MLDKLIAKWRAWNYERIAKKCERDDLLKLKVLLSNHKIDTDYTIPDEGELAWDMDTYYNGNLFLKGKSNPLRLTKDDTQVKIMSSDRYRSLMNNKLVDDMVNASTEKDISWDILHIALSATTVVLLIYVIMMNLGMV